MERIIASSMLSADFGHLDRDTRMVDRSAAQWVHIDVMDGVFVPNISFGFPVLKAIRRATSKLLDVHLMITAPERYIDRFVEAGAGIVTLHLEATAEARRALGLVREAAARASRPVLAGLSIKPATSVEALYDLLPFLDLVLVMSVEPGFGGQAFMPEALEKVRLLRERVDEQGLDVLIEVDGGVTTDNAPALWEAGADALVAGSSVFGAASPEEAIEELMR